MMLEYRNLTTVCMLTSSVIITSIYFMKKSIVRMMYLFPVSETSRGPITSIPMCENGSALIDAELAAGVPLLRALF